MTRPWEQDDDAWREQADGAPDAPTSPIYRMWKERQEQEELAKDQTTISWDDIREEFGL